MGTGTFEDAEATTLDRYRSRWTWDRVTWGTHCLNCLGACPYHVFVRDGRIVFEEPAGAVPVIQEGVPDLNPLSCQKGSAWSLQIESEERILHPMRRVGERGSGSWERITWDEALTEVADAVLEAIDLEGPESVILEETVEGGQLTQAPLLRFAGLLGAVSLDANGLVNDLPVGQHITFGKFSCASSVDDTFLADLVLVWHANPAYTSIPYFHYITEARYRGAEVVAIAPDYSASAAFSDFFVPVRPGTDAALALAMCRVILDEGLADLDFLCSQTDLSLLVLTETGRFLRGPDVAAEHAGDQFFHWDPETGLRPAPRDTLLLDSRPALEGRWTVKLSDSSEAEVTTAFQLLRERLEEYAPETVSPVCGVAPEVIVSLARRVASKRTKIIEGFNAAKYYHGDLMERSMCLLLGLTGNWGRGGTGIQGLALAGLDGYLLFAMKTKRGVDETARLLDGIDAMVAQMKEQDPTATDEMIGNQLLQMAVVSGTTTPPAFFNYHHAGYREPWNNPEWSDETMTRSFDEYLAEAVQRGWWGGLVRPDSATDPQVFFAVGTNPLRRARGGRKRMLETLWPTLEKVIVVDFRMSSTALNADILLPAAMHYERANLQYTVTQTFHLAFSDVATPPAGEAKTEWEIFRLLCRRIQELAVEREFVEYLDGRRQKKRLDNLESLFTAGGAFMTDEDVIDELVRDTAEAGTLPPGTSIDTLRREGRVRFTGLGVFASGLSLATDVSPHEVVTAYRWHVEKGVPFPTLTRRAQFYVDHPWFLEADEALPRHKEPPAMGGRRRFALTSGHSRWTVHSSAMGNRVLLETHRGQPLVVLNTAEAAELGVADGDEVRLSNDHGAFRAMARVAPRVRPGQVILYNGFEPHQFPDWEGNGEVEPGMVKWLHLVGRYGHLRYLPFGWQPVPADRSVFVDVDKVPQEVDA